MRCSECDEPWVEGSFCGNCGHRFPDMSVADRIKLSSPQPTDPTVLDETNFLGGPPKA
jgi:hypothetical protein